MEKKQDNDALYLLSVKASSCPFAIFNSYKSRNH